MKRLFLFLAVILAAGQVRAQNLSDLRNQLRWNIQDVHATRQRYSDSVLNDFLNEGQKAVVSATWLSLEVTNYALIPGVTTYVLPNDYIAAAHVQFAGTGNAINVVNEESLKSLANNNVQWQQQAGIPFSYYVDSSSTSTTMLLNVTPTPNNAQSTGTLTCWYYSRIFDLSNDSDIPFNAKLHLYPYHISLVYHATMRIKAIEAKQDQAAAYSQLYTATIADMKERIGSMPNYKPSMNFGIR